MRTIRYASMALAAQFTVVAQAQVVISPTSLPAWTVGVAYSQTLTASGCTLPCGWSSTGKLPTGLTLNSASGVISGVPRPAGTFQFTVKASNLLQSGSQDYTIVINNAPTITTTALAPGQTGVAYTQTIAVQDGTAPYTFLVSAGSLPPGVSLAAPSGVISGTPSATGTFTFTVQATDSASAKATQSYSLTITGGSSALTITTATPLPEGSVGAAYSSSLSASGGTPPYSWSVVGGVPPGGLVLTTTGALSGTPTTAGGFTFTIQVADRTSAVVNKQFSLTIVSKPQQLTISTSSFPPGVVGSAYSLTLAAAGGAPPYSWSVVSGALPGGLTLNATTGSVTGTPSAGGSFAFTVRVTDSAGAAAQQPFSIAISAGSGAPVLSLTGLSGTASSGHQATFAVALSSAYPSTITGTVTLTFQSSAAAPADDPAIQFAGGGRTAAFTIPANSTQAVFSMNPVAFQTGTVAGTITLAVTSNLPGGTVSQAITVAAAAPSIQNATVTMTASGFQIQVTGYSNSRELTGASFHFTGASGQVVQTSDLTVSLSDPAHQWYSSSAASPFGGQFLIVVPFSLQQGAASGLASVNVQLMNTQSPSTPVTASF